MENGSFYFIKDEFFDDFKEFNLMANKDKSKRPYFYCFQSKENPQIYWLVPISSKIEKYKNIDTNLKKKYGKCDTLVFGSVAGKSSVFLIQNICPVTLDYIEKIYKDKNNVPINITGKTQKEIIEKTTHVLKLYQKGISLVFTDIKKIQEKLIAHLPAKQQEFFMPKNNRNEGNIMELTLEKAQEMMAEDNGNLNISHTMITELPEGLEVNGSLDISLTMLSELPEGLEVNGNIDISHTMITELPKGLRVNGNLDIHSTKITELPKGLRVNGDLDISYTMITELPKGLEVNGNLDISGTKITELPKGLKVNGNLDISCTMITELPEGLKVGGSLDISLTMITELPEGLKVGGSLNSYLTPITELPEGLKVGGSLDISSTNITELPKGLKVNGNLDISGTKITELPKGLKVNGDLNISYTMITELPEGLEVKGNLRIFDTKIEELSIEKLPEKLFVGREIIVIPPTLLQTHEELEKWYTKRDKWETEIAKRQKQQLPHSEEKQATEKFSIDNDQITVKSIVTEKHETLVENPCINSSKSIDKILAECREKQQGKSDGAILNQKEKGR